MYLKSVTILREQFPKKNRDYPFTIPSLAKIDTIEFPRNVTFFVGENGSGKSTLLEAIAYQCEFNTGSGGRNNYYHVDRGEAAFGDYIRLSWLPKMTQGFFLRAESFYQFASHVDETARLALRPYEAYGGKSLHEQSHGEAFLALFTHRFGKKGIYLLDEPEAALSPARQLSLLAVMRKLEREGGSQFIIATHSPILLGYPGAQILSFDSAPLREIAYEETDHYQITRRFLENRQRFLTELFDEV
ncbi:UNVERIFIED_CONTAM: putative ATPase [Brevibacillus sp. OAP136]